MWSDIGTFVCIADIGFGATVQNQIELVIGGELQCVFSAICITEKSAHNELSILFFSFNLNDFSIIFYSEPPSVVIRIPHGGNLYLTGDNVTMECVVKGDPTPNVKWSKDGEHINETDRIKIEPGVILRKK